MTQPQDREAIAADVEEQRARDDEQREALRERDEADLAERAEREDAPEQPAGLYGDELNAGVRKGVHTTHNESPVPGNAAQGGPAGTNFVTGADGEPRLAEEGMVPERPGGELPVTDELPRDEDERAEVRQEQAREVRGDEADEEEAEHETTEGRAQMEDEGMPVANVRTEDNRNTGQSPGVNDT